MSTEGTPRLRDVCVAITGAGSGIGRATALRVLSEGARVGAIDRDAGALESLVREAGGTARLNTATADIRNADSIGEAIDSTARGLGGLDVVFANAGIGMDPKPVDDLTLDEWNTVIAVNLTGAFNTLRAGIPHLRARGGGLLMATGSSTAIRPGQGMLPYVASKAGVHTIIRSLALELAPEGIRAVVLAPGLTRTNMTRTRDGYIERGLQAVPTGKLVELDDVAATAAFLMSRESHSITGSTFVVDAGRTSV